MREKLIDLIEEAEEHSTDICVYTSDCKDCPSRKYGNKCREYLKADHLITNGVTIPTLCEHCQCSDTISCSSGRVWCSRMMRYMKLDGFCSEGKEKEQ